ncbi:MAG: hypothetical protein AMXMBFR23_07990 [Chloroflexota bacterium]
MTTSWPSIWRAALLGILLLAPACSSSDGDDATPEAFADPFAYCAAVRDIDAPDTRYTGDPLPPVIIEGIRTATGASADAPLEFFERGTSWRCMDGAVYACTVGANLPCEAKADTSDTPSAAMAAFCAENAGAEVIPAAVTGRETVYAWRCEGETPSIERQVMQVDARGFLADIWYRLDAPGR